MKTKYKRAKPYFSKEDREDITSKIDDILKTGQIAQGKYVSEFEDKFAKKIGSKYAIATNSCTSALEVSIRALEIKNKIFLVPTNTFVASVNAIILSGNTPLIVDIDKDTLCMTKESILENLTDEVGAVMWVHMAGLISPDILEVKELCERNGIDLIEDAAHAHGASIYNQYKDEIIMAGNIGDVGCFSFYPTKVMATGEGGMITTNHSDLNRKAQIMRYHGVTRPVGELEGVDYGVTAHYSSQNFRMTETSAIIGLSQLSHLNDFVTKRNEIANLYDAQLDNVEGINLLPRQEFSYSSYWNYYFILDEKIDRDRLANYLYINGIENANAYYPACHHHLIYKDYILEEYPIADDVLKRHLSLPMYFELSVDDTKYITDKVIEGVRKLK